MGNALKFYEIGMKYVRNLSNVDDNVMSVSPQIGKSSRPFVGILLLVNGRKYCVPLSSPKPKFEGKKNAVDFMRILDSTKKNEHGAYVMIGGLNLNNMLPVTESVLSEIDIKIKRSDSSKAVSHKTLLAKQLDWCQKNQATILKRANRLYSLITQYPENNKNLTRRCCDFKKLEAVLDKMMKREKTAEYIKQNPDKISDLLKESDRILNSNPYLKKLYEAAEAEYFKNTGSASANPTSSVAERYYERNAVISSNSKLKEEYVAIKNKIRDQSRADSLPSTPKPKKH